MAKRRWKGHCLLCALNRLTFRNAGADYVPWKVKRQLGQKRRLSDPLDRR